MSFTSTSLKIVLASCLGLTFLLPGVSEGTPTSAIDKDERSLVQAVTLGRLTETEAEFAVATALKAPPRHRDRILGKTWQLYKSPSKDRIVFHWIRQEGPRENFVQLFSFWIRHPRPGDSPDFGLLTYVGDECEIYLNGEKKEARQTQPIDVRTLYHWDGWSLRSGWNHFLILVRSKQLETDKPGTLALRLRSGDPVILNEWDSAAERPREEADRPPRTAPPENAADPSTLHGKLMCGYQGWFHAEGDGSYNGWSHYNGQGGRFEPGICSIDLWPDMSEMDEDEKYPTAFKHADGSPAFVFSSQNPKTVLRHFGWMERYGLDGVFLQRFAVSVQDERQRSFRQVVLENVRDGAEKHGRTWAMMYDLSGVGENRLMPLVTEDWKKLVDENRIREDAMYQHHGGKPVVALWGIGFNDQRKYTLRECMELVTFLKEDPTYGGNTVMLGVPTYWRELHRDSLDDPFLHEIIRKADIVSPWTVGRYGNLEHFERYLKVAGDDKQWCREQGKDYLPVVFPGFSWHNLMKNREKEAKPDAIPRLKGEFLIEQIKGHLGQDSTMIYQAMFDEVDEATAIFKCTNQPPVGESPFITYEGLPEDFYLKLLGKASKALKRKAAR